MKKSEEWKNWTYIILNINSNDVKKIKNIKKWLKNINGKYYKYSNKQYFFKNIADAILFKLTWT